MVAALLSVVHWVTPCVKKNCQLIFGPVKKRFTKVPIWTKFILNSEKKGKKHFKKHFYIFLNFFINSSFKNLKNRLNTWENFEKKYWLLASKLIVYFQADISKTVNAKKEKWVSLFSFEILPIDVTFKASESKIQNIGGKSRKSQQFFEKYVCVQSWKAAHLATLEIRVENREIFWEIWHFDKN